MADLSPIIGRRFKAVNGWAAKVEPVHIQDDGHGVYAVISHHKSRHTYMQLFVNKPEALSLERKGHNKNLDSHLRL